MVKAAMPRSYLGADGRNDRIEVGGDDFGIETEDVAHGAGKIHVVADLGLAVGVEEFGRGVGGVGADGELAVLGHGFRQQCGDCIVLLHGAHVVAGDGGGIGALGGVRTGIGLSEGGRKRRWRTCMAELSARAIRTSVCGLHNRFPSSLLRRLCGNDQRLSIFIHYSAYIYKRLPPQSNRESSIVTETTRRTG